MTGRTDSPAFVCLSKQTQTPQEQGQPEDAGGVGAHQQCACNKPLVGAALRQAALLELVIK
jgi:hypothetical protein